MLNRGKQWVSFDKPTWFLVMYCLLALGFMLSYIFAILTGYW